MRRTVRQKVKRRSERTYRQPSIYSRTAEMGDKRGGKSAKFIMLFIILLFGATYLFFFSPVFMIKTINISETKYVDRAGLDRATQDYIKKFLNQNIITFNSKKLINEISDSSGIKEIKIKRVFPNTLSLQIKEREPVFILEHPSGRYLIDDSGYTFKLSDDNYKNIQTIKDSRGLDVSNDTRAFHTNFIFFIKEVFADFNRLSGTSIKSVELVNTIDELKIVTESGWYVYLNPEFTANNQLINLSRVIVDAKNKNIKLEYVDLRTENRIFYK